jgi:hypothetical protein
MLPLQLRLHHPFSGIRPPAFDPERVTMELSPRPQAVLRTRTPRRASSVVGASAAAVAAAAAAAVAAAEAAELSEVPPLASLSLNEALAEQLSIYEQRLFARVRGTAFLMLCLLTSSRSFLLVLLTRPFLCLFANLCRCGGASICARDFRGVPSVCLC